MRFVSECCILQELISGFDQEAAAVVMARQVSFKMETEVIYYSFSGSDSVKKNCELLLFKIPYSEAQNNL